MGNSTRWRKLMEWIAELRWKRQVAVKVAELTRKIEEIKRNVKTQATE